MGSTSEPAAPGGPFPGFAAYLERAAAERGGGAAAGRRSAWRDRTLAAVATLCAQAEGRPEAEAAAVWRQAEALLDELRLAARAGELMVRELGRRLGVAPGPGPRRGTVRGAAGDAPGAGPGEA